MQPSVSVDVPAVSFSPYNLAAKSDNNPEDEIESTVKVSQT